MSQASVVEERRFAADPQSSDLERLYRQLDREDDQVWSMDLDPLVCPFLPICDPIIAGEVVTTDGNHLTRTLAETLAPAVTEFLAQNGLIPQVPT